MDATLDCPDVDRLRSVTLQGGPADEVETLSRHVEQCPGCAALVDEWLAADEISAALRTPTLIGDPAEQTAVNRLIARIESLRPATSGTDATVLTDGNDTSQADPPGWIVGPTAADATQEGLELFLQPPQSADEMGRLGPYRVLRLLGSGGMGVVFEAEDPQLQRRVALKAMRPATAGGAGAAQRFLREARAMAAVRHDHIVTVYQVGEDRGVPFLAMEFLEGEPLDRRLARNGRLPVADALRIGREVAEGLAAAHGRGLIHRDIKPANIWLEGDRRRVKLLDFGLARSTAEEAQLTHQGTILGTPAYMAPEQARGEEIDARVDLFSLGAVLYQMCVGRQPFRGRDVVSTLMAVAAADPPPPDEISPDVPAPLSELVMRLLAKRPDDRPESAQAVVNEVAAIERELERQAQTIDWTGTDAERSAVGVTAAQPSASGTSGRRRALTSAALLSLFGGLLAGVVLIIQHRDGSQTKLELPDGSTATVGQDQTITIRPPGVAKPLDKPAGTGAAPAQLATPPTVLGPFDALRREDIPPEVLSDAGGGDSAQAPEELVAVIGDSRWRTGDSQIHGIRVGTFSPDGSLLAVRASDAVRLWDTASGRLRRVLPVPGNILVFSPDGSQIATVAASGSENVTLWDVASGQPLRTLTGHSNTVWSAAFSPDGRHLATGAADKTVRLWDVETGKTLQTLTGHSQAVHGLAFSPDGRYLASGSGISTTSTAQQACEVKLWEAATAQEVHSFPETGGVRSLAFSGSRQLIYGFIKLPGIRMRDVESGQEVAFLEDASAQQRGLAVSRDGRWLVAWSRDSQHLHIWDLADLAAAPVRLPVGQRYAIQEIAPDNRTLALHGRLIEFYDLSTGEYTRSPDGPYGGVQSLDVSPDGAQMFVSHTDQQPLRVWDMARVQELPERRRNRMGGQLCGAALSGDGTRLAWPAGGGRITLLEAATGQELRTLKEDGGQVLNLALSPDGTRLASINMPDSAVQGTVRMWDATLGQQLFSLPGKARNVAFSPDGRRLATANINNLVKVWEADTGQELLSLEGHSAYMIQVAFSPDGTRLASVDGRGEVRFWDAEQGELLSTTEAGRHSEYKIAFSPDGEWLAVGGGTGSVVLLEAATGQELRRLTLPWGVKCLAFAPDGRHLLTGNANSTVYVFRLAPPPGGEAGTAAASE